MRSLHIALFAMTCVLAAPSAAQSGTASAGEGTSPDSVQPAPKKKGGMFGKVKGLAKSKVVKTVAKAVLCTAVPGGQVIAGALDAADNKGAAGVASTALSGGSTSCMPGMGGNGMAGAAAAGLGGNGLGGAAVSVGLGTAAALAGGGVPGMPGGMPGGAMPGGGISPEQLKQMMDAYSKMGMDPAQLKAMQQMMAAQMGPATAVPTTELKSEAPGKTIQLSSDLVADLKKGRAVVRNIDWVAGSSSVSPAGSEGFTLALAQIAAAIREARGSYRLDLYMDKRYEDTAIQQLGPERLSVIQAGRRDGHHGGQGRGHQEGQGSTTRNREDQVVTHDHLG